MNSMKKIIAFLLAVCTVVGTMTSLLMVSGGVSVYADEAETEETVSNNVDAWSYFTTKYASDIEKLHKMSKFIENEQFALYGLEKTGEVAVENKKTGQIMFSNPRDIYLYSTATADTKAKENAEFKDLASQLFVDFTIISTNENQVLNSYADAAMNNQITMSAIKNGVAVEYTIGTGDDRKLVPMNIEKTRYEENILNLIEDPNAYKRMSSQGGIYSLKDPTAVSEVQKELMYEQYPVIEKKGIAIYVCDENLSNYEKNKIEGWIRAWAPKYTFEELEYDHELTEYVGSNKVMPVFKMALEYKLTDDGFTVRLPASSITFDEDYFKLNSVTILPYMGAGSSEYDGYTLVPDGSGTILRFEDLRSYNIYKLLGELYGPDNAYHTFSESYTGKMEVWRYPVFGMVENFYRYFNNDTNKEYCGHTTRTLLSTVPASCSTEGYSNYKCDICGEEMKDDFVAATHPESSLKKVVPLSTPASCVNVATDVYVCIECGMYVYKYGEAIGTAHCYETLDNGDKICKSCNKYTPATPVEAFKAPEGYTKNLAKSTPATCTTAGEDVYSYTPVADENGVIPEYDPSEYPDIPVKVLPLGHGIQIKKYASSCREGYSIVSCKTCNIQFSVFGTDFEQAPVGYTPDASTTKAPTCTEDGKIVFVKKDAENIEVTVPARHQFVIVTSVDDKGDGKNVEVVYTAICTACGHSVEDVEKVEPSKTYENPSKVLTHVEVTDGDKTIEGYLIKTNPVKITSSSSNHRYVAIKEVASDCETGVQGYTIRCCYGCGDVIVEANVGCHEWDNGVQKYAATVATTGLKLFTCGVCKAIRYEITAKIEKVDSIPLDNLYLTLTGGEEPVTGTIELKEFADFDTEENRAALVYTTSDEKIATVANGVITAVGAGQATITVSLTVGDTIVYNATCVVIVEAAADDETSTVVKVEQPANTYKKFDPRGYVAIITEGESLCTVTSIHGGTIYKYNSVYLTVNPRPSDTYELTGALTVSGDAKYTVVSDRKYTGSYRIRYYMLSDQEDSDFEASYAGMAKAYRHYLEVSGQLTDLKATENIPLYLETLGSVKVNDTFLSMPIVKDAALTSFDDIIKINDELKAAGITNIQYRLTGYTNGGMVPTMPYDIEFVEVLGGNSGYKKLMAYAEKNGIGIYTDYDFTYMHADEWFDGYSNGDHAVKAIDDRYIIKKTYDATYQAFTPTALLAVSPSVFEYFYDHFVVEDKKLGSTGISVSTLGTDLNSDFDSDEPYNREDSKLFVEEVLAKMEADYNGKVMTDGGNSYVLPYAQHILNMSLLGSERMKTSASVPFFSMVLHGAVNYAGKPTNMASSMNEEILRIIENGAAPYFVLAYQNQSALKESKSLSKYYAVSFSHWKKDIIDVYNELNSVLGGLQNATYNNHEYLTAERVPGEVEYTASYEKLIDEIIALFEKYETASDNLKKSQELLDRYIAPINEAGAEIEVLVEKVNNGTATEADILLINEKVAELSVTINAVNKYESNVANKETALITAENNLRKKLETVTGLFDVSNIMDKSQYTKENFKGYGSFVDGKFTPRADDFTSVNGTYVTTDYTVSDSSVVRTGWDKNGDKKDDVVILLNYNTFDVYVYIDGKPVVIPAMGYVVQ
ncbi:MAG: hypothetical protein E7616_01630 [Ruminococcaceae bacterium]|nr:hypothetical protein [Oscillospiraceae bacterium]